MSQPEEPAARRLRVDETAAIARFGEGLPSEEQRQLTKDLRSASIEVSSRHGGTIWTFHLPGYQRPEPAEGDLVPVEGLVDDEDGSEVAVWLELDGNGRIAELQLTRLRAGDVKSPRWPTIRTRSADVPRPSRHFSAGELSAIREFARTMPEPAARQALADAPTAAVVPISTDDSWFRITIAGYTSPGKLRQLRAEGLVQDTDGASIRVWLFLDANDRLAELELIREADGGVIDPVWSTFKLASSGIGDAQ